MGWFDEQIRQRKLSDQELFEESIYQMASVVLGKQRAGALDDERIITKKALLVGGSFVAAVKRIYIQDVDDKALA